MTKIAFVDTETTGLDRQRHDMWELAMEIYTVDEVGRLEDHVESIHEFVMPLVSDADPSAMRMNKYYQRTSSPSFEWAADEMAVGERVATILGTDDCHLAGMQVDFDDAFISRWLREQGQVAANHYHIIELESAMAAALRQRGEAVPIPWKSDNLSKALGVPPPEKGKRHTAVADALWAVQVYAAIFGTNFPQDQEDEVPDWAQVPEGSEA